MYRIKKINHMKILKTSIKRRGYIAVKRIFSQHSTVIVIIYFIIF